MMIQKLFSRLEIKVSYISTITLMLGFFAHSAFAQTQTIEAVCDQLMQNKNLLDPSEYSELKLLLNLEFDKKSFIAPLPVSPIQPNGQAGAAQAYAAAPDADVQSLTIFTLGNLPGQNAEDAEVLKKLTDRSKQEMKIVQELLKTENSAECVSRAQSLHWAPDELISFQNEQNSAAVLDAERRQETEVSFKMAQEVKKDHPSWDIVQVNSWGEVLQSLRSHPVSGMILIAHSDPNGRLYDSERDELPSGFFNAIPDAVRFVGVYSCDSGKVIPAYSLNHLNIHRDVVAVQLGAPFNQAESTPIQLLPTWVDEVENQGLFELVSDTSASEAECSIQMQNLNLTGGRLSVSIDGLPIGVWSVGVGSDDNLSRSQLLPCSWVNDPRKLDLLVEPSSETVSFDGAPVFSIQIQNGKNSYGFSQAKLYSTASGAFRSAILSEGQ